MKYDTTTRLIWLLMWSILFVVLLMGQYSLKLERDRERLHAQVEASINPPEVKIMREPTR